MDEPLYANEDDLCDGYEMTRPRENNAPSLNLWYHGKLDRVLAEERLMQSGVYGGYLVRESDQNPGSYVLSFLGCTGVTHFRIISVCGELYIGGRQFDSLLQLIAYYSFKSCLLQDERLEKPIPPPEPVDDRRRVKALFPYHAIPDTDNDELSFEKDEVFIFHNDMGDDWMWVTSLRTNKSGCVFKGLVRDLDYSVDPHEGKEWFHSIITKEQAYNLLMSFDRVGSYLVRPSDSTPGDYVLYFYTGSSIQRFKILRKNYNKFEMGGRSYDNIDDIIQHYKREQIVRGLHLDHAIAQTTSVSRECTDDIYLTIRRQGQFGKAIFSQSNVVKRGYLYKKGVGKRSHDTKKWRHLFFVLDGEKQHLYCFDHDKKTKPKGLVDLSYAAVYLVHDSYFGKPHCFKIVVHALNEVSSSHYCADSGDILQEWVRHLQAYCRKPNRRPIPNLRRARQVRTLSITLDSCRKLPAKVIPTYCTIDLNEVTVARTKIQSGTEPVWNEEFRFDDLPPDVDSVGVSLQNAAKKKQCLGHITIHFSKLGIGKYIDKWYNLSPPPQATGVLFALTESFLTSNLQTNFIGSIRMKSKLTNELIMPAQEYFELKNVILQNMNVVFALSDICGQDRNSLASVLLKVFRDEKREIDLLTALNQREISAADAEPGTLFRATTLASTLMELYMRTTCSSFLSLALKDVVKQIHESRQTCELNPAKLPEGSTIEENYACLIGHLRATVTSIMQTQSIFPKDLRFVFGKLQQLVSTRWSQDKCIKTRVVSGFVFLRLICPAIITPNMFGIISETPTATASRNLLLVAKCIQNLANLVEFGAKEEYMICVNPFITENKSRIIQFMDDIGNNEAQNKHVSKSFSHRVDLSKDLSLLHHVCVDHLHELQALSTKKPYLKKLLGILELLNRRQSSYLRKIRDET